jgi:hypothetical protein
VVGNTVVGGVNKTLSKGHVMVDGVNKTLVKSYANVNGIWVPTFKYETLTETTWKKYTAEQVITSSRYSAAFNLINSTMFWYDVSYNGGEEPLNYPGSEFESRYDGWRVYKDYTDISNSAGISITVFESDYVLTIGSGSFNELKEIMGAEWTSDLYMVPGGDKTNGIDAISNLWGRHEVGSAFSYDADSFYIQCVEGSLHADHTYKWVCGDYIEDVTSYDSSEYPINGRSGDYWYIKQ